MTPTKPNNVDRTSVVTKILNEFLPVFGALMAILAVRLLLLLAVIGAFVLAQTAMTDTTNHGTIVLAVYCAMTVLPLVFMDVKERSRK